jgi:CubicO group peptidase (beta-lactamase class C family)
LSIQHGRETDSPKRLLGFIVRHISVIVVLLLFWGVAVAMGTLSGWFRQPIAPSGDVASFARAAKGIIDRENGGNAAFVLIKDGVVVDEHFVSRGNAVDRDTLFQVASLSKWLTAWGVLRLVDEGKVNLDAPVSRYTKRWRLPDGPFDEDQVTVRRLLSHTAGLTDGLGYGGFTPGKAVPSLVESLTHTVDASPGADGRVRVGAQPGGEFHYSGGGYALLQLVIEDVSGETFDAYMKRTVFNPLGMNKSGFVAPEGNSNVAQSFNTKGQPELLYNFSAPAATSLYTSAADLTRLIQSFKVGSNGEPLGRGVLSARALARMQHPEAKQYGAEVWGLGVVLYAQNNHDGFIIGHDGTNTPAINTTARVDPFSGSGIIVLETGKRNLATRLGGEWVFWQTGNVDLFDVIAVVPHALRAFAVGAFAILVAGLFAMFYRWRKSKLNNKASKAAKIT